MKPKLTIVVLLAALLLQGCANTIYHFDAAQYFKNKNYSKEMPFHVSGGSVSPALLAQRADAKSNVADIPKYKGSGNMHWFKNNKLNVSGSFTEGGGDLKINYSPAKKIMLSINLSGTSKESWEEGNIGVAYTRYVETAVWSGYDIDTTYGTENFVYEKEHTFKQEHKDISIGYYNSFGNHGIYEASGGWGLGSAKNQYKYTITENGGYEAIFSESRNYYKVFVQNNVGYSTKVTQGALCMRLTYLRFTGQDFNTAYEIETYQMKKVNMLIEPALHFGAGGKKLRGFFEYGFVIPLGNLDTDWNGSFRLGASFRI